MVAAAFNTASPFHRPFSLVDLSISYPYESSQVTVWMLAVFTGVVPALIVAGVCVLFVPGHATNPVASRETIWRRKIWEWNAAWMGLALSHGLALMITHGMKNAFGKPRPDLLSRCQPDIANAGKYAVSQYAQQFNPQWMLVTWQICQQNDRGHVNEGFKSFPSGHASSRSPCYLPAHSALTVSQPLGRVCSTSLSSCAPSLLLLYHSSQLEEQWNEQEVDTIQTTRFTQTRPL